MCSIPVVYRQTNVDIAEGAFGSEVGFASPYCPINDPSSLNLLGSTSPYSAILSVSLPPTTFSVSASKESGLPAAKGSVSPLKMIILFV